MLLNQVKIRNVRHTLENVHLCATSSVIIILCPLSLIVMETLELAVIVLGNFWLQCYMVSKIQR